MDRRVEIVISDEHDWLAWRRTGRHDRASTARLASIMSDAATQRETINQSTRQARCAHALCKCTVPQGERYCGEHCAREAARPSRAEGSRCGCAHAPCDESAG